MPGGQPLDSYGRSMKIARRLGIVVALLAAASLTGCAEATPLLDAVPAAATFGHVAATAPAAPHVGRSTASVSPAAAAKALAARCEPAAKGALKAVLPKSPAFWSKGTYDAVPTWTATSPRYALFDTAGAVVCSWSGRAPHTVDSLEVAALAAGDAQFAVKKASVTGSGTAVTATTYRDCSVSSDGWGCEVGVLVGHVWVGALYEGDTDISASTAATRATHLLAALRWAYRAGYAHTVTAAASSWADPSDCTAFDSGDSIAAAAGVTVDSVDSADTSIDMDPAGATLARTNYFGCDWWQTAGSSTVELQVQVLPGGRPAANAFRASKGGTSRAVTVTGATRAAYRVDAAGTLRRVDAASADGWIEVRAEGTKSDVSTVSQTDLLAAANQALHLLSNQG